jgi:SAM-dependent methyltransferase
MELESERQMLGLGLRRRFREAFPTMGPWIEHHLLPHDFRYPRSYYKNDVESTAAPSAASMAKAMYEWATPSSVVDVGCGTGALLASFRECGATRLLGLEYSTAGIEFCRKRRLPVTRFKIGRDRIPSDQFDLAVSFEVAEHLSPQIADRYVDLLCALSGRIVMSAATPNQGGSDHVNEQPHSYWIKKLERRGYKYRESQSSKFRQQWREANTAPWYSDNVMVFCRR